MEFCCNSTNSHGILVRYIKIKFKTTKIKLQLINFFFSDSFSNKCLCTNGVTMNQQDVLLVEFVILLWLLISTLTNNNYH